MSGFTLNAFTFITAWKVSRILGNTIAVVLLVVATHQVSDAQDNRRQGGGGISINGSGIIGAIIQSEINRQRQVQPQRRQRTYVPRQAYRRYKTVRTRSVRVKQARTRYARRGRRETAVVYVAPKPSRATVEPTAVAVPIISAPAPTTGTIISTQSEITAAQQHLKFMGYDVPNSSGVFDLKTKIAVMQFQETIDAETTGEMTMDQLQVLFQKVAEKTKENKSPGASGQ